MSLNLAWNRLITPEGKEYFFNSETNESVWERPLDYIPKPPPRNKIENVIELKYIPDTDWCICLTSKDHEFFYNPKTNVSVWDMPDDIVDIVGGLLQDAMELEFDDDEQSEIEEAMDGQDMEEDQEIVDQESENNSVDDPIVVVEHKILSVENAEKQVKRPLEELRNEFNDLLRERDISPFSTWELEKDKLLLDPRYQSLPPKECKSLFESYCTMHAQLVVKEKQTRQNDAKADYISLLKEQVTKRIRFEDFQRKYKRDVRFTKFENGTEKETLFQEHIKAITLAEQKNTTLVFLGLLRDSKFISKSSTWTVVLCH